MITVISGSLDVCKHHPECGKGVCVQVREESGQRTAKCECSGSGYHGQHCEHSKYTYTRS